MEIGQMDDQLDVASGDHPLGQQRGLACIEPPEPEKLDISSQSKRRIIFFYQRVHDQLKIASRKPEASVYGPLFINEAYALRIPYPPPLEAHLKRRKGQPETVAKPVGTANVHIQGICCMDSCESFQIPQAAATCRKWFSTTAGEITSMISQGSSPAFQNACHCPLGSNTSWPGSAITIMLPGNAP